MAVRYSALGGKQTFMNDYERADQDALMRNAALQAAADQFSAQMGHDARMQDDRQQAAFEDLDRRNQFTLDRDMMRPDYNQYYQQGGQQVAGLSNEQRLALMPLEQQIRESQLNRGVRTEGIRDEVFNALVPEGAANPIIDAYTQSVMDDPQLAIAALSGILGDSGVSRMLSERDRTEALKEERQTAREDTNRQRLYDMLLARANAAGQVGDTATQNALLGQAQALYALPDMPESAPVQAPTPQGAPARRMAGQVVAEAMLDPAMARDIDAAVVALAEGDERAFDRITDQVIQEAAAKNIPEDVVMQQLQAAISESGIIPAAREAAVDQVDVPFFPDWLAPLTPGVSGARRLLGQETADARLRQRGIEEGVR